MAFHRTFLALLLFAAAMAGPVLGAEQKIELRTLKGEVVSGDLASVSDTEVVVARGTEKRTLAVKEILQIDISQPGRLPADSRLIDVELTDGTLLHCSAFTVKGKTAELTPALTGQLVKVPLSAIANVLSDAQLDKHRKEWTARVAKKPQRDVVAVLKEGLPNGLEGTLGEGDDMGKTIAFTLGSGQKIDIPLANIHGLIFFRTVDPNATPPELKLVDTYQNVVLVTNAVSTPTGLTVTTPSGCKLEYTLPQVVKLDYSKGKLLFLSDLEPIRVTETPQEELGRRYQRDRNLDQSGPLRIQGQVFSKGLAIHGETELEYDLGGEYREFKAVLGIDDDDLKTDTPDLVLLKIEGDGKELYKTSISLKDKVRSRPLTLNIKDVIKLRITVSSSNPIKLHRGANLDLADAKVSK